MLGVFWFQILLFCSNGLPYSLPHPVESTSSTAEFSLQIFLGEYPHLRWGGWVADFDSVPWVLERSRTQVWVISDVVKSFGKTVPVRLGVGDLIAP